MILILNILIGITFLLIKKRVIKLRFFASSFLQQRKISEKLSEYVHINVLGVLGTCCCFFWICSLPKIAVISPNFHTKKLGKITAIYAVAVCTLLVVQCQTLSHEEHFVESGLVPYFLLLYPHWWKRWEKMIRISMVLLLSCLFCEAGRKSGLD